MFWRGLAIEWFDNTIGFELGDNGRPNGYCKIPVYVPRDKITAKHYVQMWDPIKKRKKVKQKYQNQR